MREVVLPAPDIHTAKNAVVEFFDAGNDVDLLLPIKSFLGLSAAGFDELGNLTDDHVASLAFTNPQSELIVVFLCNRHAPGGAQYQMFCKTGGQLYQFTSEVGEGVFDRTVFGKWQAIEMLDAAKSFADGNQDERLVLSESELAKRIIKEWRSS